MTHIQDILNHLEEEYHKTPITERRQLGEYMAQKCLEIVRKRAERQVMSEDVIGWEECSLRAYRNVKERDKEMLYTQELERLLEQVLTTMYW